MSEQKVLIDCRDAALGYEGRPIWEHLTFQVRRGDYLCIVGDNGSGKSTLLKSMLGLLRPLSGEIRLDESLRRGAIGYLPQQTDLYRTLRYLNRTEGMAVVMVTHDIRSALRDAAAILHAGRDQWFLGTPGEYLASPYGKRFGGDLS